MRSTYLTDIERIMQKALKDNNIKAIQQYPIRGGLILDFVIPDKKICIECDGEAYHPIGNNKDRKRDWVLRKKGWKILRFRGQEIINNVDKCIQKIKLCL